MQADLWGDPLLEDLLWRSHSDLLDLHPPSGTGHDHRKPTRPVYSDPKIDLRLNIRSFLDEDPMNHSPSGPCLMRDQGMIQHLLRRILSGLRRIDEHHSARLSPTPGVDLRFHHHRRSKRAGNLPRLLRCGGHFSPGNGNSEGRKKHLCLVFVDLHHASSTRGGVKNSRTKARTCQGSSTANNLVAPVSSMFVICLLPRPLTRVTSCVI